MRPSIKLLTTRVWGVLFLCSALKFLCLQPVHAETTEPLNCTTAFQIVQTFANQGKWEMCWEPKAGYGYKLSQIIFTPPNGIRRKIMGEMHAAQLFVPYDDNLARYHDISYGVNLAPLLAAECPGGTLLTNSRLCLLRRPAGYAYKNISTGSSRKSDSFELFGYYGVGNYYYAFKYTFFDDGSIEPSVLASGSLQRYGGSQLTGWPVGSQNSVNHNHLVIWRMDFDLDGPANNRVEQIEFADSGTDNRAMTVSPLLTETKATNDLNKLRFWRVRNTAQNNNDGRNISYEIEPSVSDQLRASEDFTQNDFYLTQHRTSEILVDDGLVSFVNGETITDAVVWYGVNFHHVPRGEDDVKMPAHSQGFRIRPRDMTAEVASNQNALPVITNPGTQTTAVSRSVNLQIIASDINPGDVLSYSASGLPAGLTINSATGLISGTTAATASTNAVTVTVSDGNPGGTTNANFAWNVTASGAGQQTFTVPGAITIRDNAAALPYPININVSGLTGTVSKVAVTLNGLSHSYPSDIDIMLVGPAGQKAMLMSDAGGGIAVNNATLTFDPASLVDVPQGTAITSGTYNPANYGATDIFPAPGPAAPYPDDLRVFNGTSANGTWQLYVLDDEATDAGQILNGVSLSITTGTTTDTTAPTVSSRSPAGGSTGVALATTVSAKLSEAMTATTISNSTFILQGPSGNVTASVTYNASTFTATLAPQTALLANTSYTVTLKGGVSGAKDLAGNPLLADVSWSFTTQSTAATTQSFTVPGAITIRDNATALPYPININVSGLTATVSKVAVTLNGLSHSYPADIDIMLVGPGGQKAMLMSDAGGGIAINNATLTFDPASLVDVPQGTAIASGTYNPANYGAADTFPAPAPAAPYPDNLSVFSGTSANGTWRLYVLDDEAADAGQILNGIVLKITTN